MFQDFGSPDAPKKKSDGTARKNNDQLFTVGAKQNVTFPDAENVTTAEIATFFPNWLREHDPTFRLASNGASNALITEIINHHRHVSNKGDLLNNSLCKLMQTPMRVVDLYKYQVTKMVDHKQVTKVEEWSILHHNQNNTKDYWGTWDPQSLAVGKVHFGNQDRAGPLESVNFLELAEGVHVFPSLESGDGLDLTRCVQYAKQHPEQTFMFPEDFSKLCDIVGRTQVENKHLDRPTFVRWADKIKEDKKAARAARLAARLAAPSTGAAKTNRSKIAKTRFVDPKAKVNKLEAKINEAVENGRLALGPNNELILLDKPKVKVEPVNPAAGRRTQSSAHNSPVWPDGDQSLAQAYTLPTGEVGQQPQAGAHNALPEFLSNTFDAQAYEVRHAPSLGPFAQHPAPLPDHGAPSGPEDHAQHTTINSMGLLDYVVSPRSRPVPEYAPPQNAYTAHGFVPYDCRPNVNPSMVPENAVASDSTQPAVAPPFQYPFEESLDLTGLVEDGFTAQATQALWQAPAAYLDGDQYPVQSGSGAEDGWAGASFPGEFGVDSPFDEQTASPHR